VQWLSTRRLVTFSSKKPVNTQPVATLNASVPICGTTVWTFNNYSAGVVGRRSITAKGKTKPLDNTTFVRQITDNVLLDTLELEERAENFIHLLGVIERTVNNGGDFEHLFSIATQHAYLSTKDCESNYLAFTEKVRKNAERERKQLDK
jgi:hypothetical protein